MTTPTFSPASSTTSTAVDPQPQITNGDQITTLAEDTGRLSVNGAVPPKKPKMTHRLTRMFSKTPEPVNRDAAEATAKHKLAEAQPDHLSPANGVPNPPIPSRQGSQEQKDARGSPDRRISMLGGHKAKEADFHQMQHKRVEVAEDGTHTHYLKSTKRQEKLSDMVRDMLGASKK